jgi:hypothetical protein
MGNGRFCYEVGKTYTEPKANCVENGFHCVEEPIDVLRWYSSRDSRYAMVYARGDINEDGNRKISCTQMEIRRELTLEEIGALQCWWMQKHPEREWSSLVQKDEGYAGADGIAVVYGPDPRAMGGMGSTLFLVRTKGKEVLEVQAIRIDGGKYMPAKFYGIRGEECEEG